MRHRIPFVCSLALALSSTGQPLRAQNTESDEATVGLLARLLAVADARQFDGAALRAGLGSDNVSIRVQTALAAGRIGDARAVELLVPALTDSSGTVQGAAAFALGMLRDPAAVDPLLGIVRAVPPETQGSRELEAVTALAKIGGEAGAGAIQQILEGASLGRPVSPAASMALLEAWRLGPRAPVAQLLSYAEHPDPIVQGRALYSLSRLRSVAAQPLLLRALGSQSPEVRAIAGRGLSAALADSTTLGRGAVSARLRPLVNDENAAVRINALRAFASFRGDSALVPAAIGALADADAGVVVQAETTLGVLGGSTAVAALRREAGSAQFAVRRQSIIALGEADTAAGTAAAAVAATDADWHWRSVAAEALAAARNRPRLEAMLGDPDGRVVAQALQGLTRLASDSDAALHERARMLLEHPDAAVRSVAAEILGRHPDPGDIDRLIAAYRRAAGDDFNDARLSAVAALGAIAAASTTGRLRILATFVSGLPRPDDHLVRRLAAERIPGAVDEWGSGDGPVPTGKTDADYREIVRRYLLPALRGQPNPTVTIEMERGTVTLELLPSQAPLTVASFLALVDRRFFDGQRWHRVVPNFVAQAGDPRGDGWGGPGTTLRDEINPLRFGPGSVGIALSGPDTGGSQFFLTHGAQPHLDGTYTIFARVTSDIRVLRQVGQGESIRSIRR
jgi:cyclophilin family peptidyl-prolyl cis-trans isomerase/HEAT repeat protein